MARYYLSTAADAVRFDTPTYQLYVGLLPGDTILGFAEVLGFTPGYVGPFLSSTGIMQVYLTASSGIQYRQIQATDNPATFPVSTANPLAVLYLDEVNRIQQIVDYTTGTGIPRP